MAGCVTHLQKLSAVFLRIRIMYLLDAAPNSQIAERAYPIAKR